MSITVQYSSTRREVWGLYLQLWKRRLWKIHLVIFVTTFVVGSFATFGRLPNDAAELLAIVVSALIPISLLTAYPMLMFKPQTRVLTVDESGITTTIGPYTNKSVVWAEIAEVQDNGQAVIIQRRNLNAFIVPARAFSSSDEKLAFEEFVRACTNAD